MKYIKHIALIVIMLMLVLPHKTIASNKLTIYLFHGSTCPHCQAEIEYLETIKGDYPNIELITYEVWENNNNAELFQNVKKKLETDSKGVPFFVIGNRYLTGFNEYRKEDIKDAIKYYIDNPNNYKDIVNQVINNKSDVEDKKYVAVNMSDVSNKKTYKEILYLSIAALSLLVIYWYIRMREKRVK